MAGRNRVNNLASGDRKEADRRREKLSEIMAWF